MNVVTLQTASPTSRVLRNPKHKFQLRTRPFAITPFCIAPVLPGETLENMYFEMREVTDPIKNSILGWSSEVAFFYVKIRDLADRDTLDDLFIAPTQNITSLNTNVDVNFYHRGGSPNYISMCLRRITEVYFRDEEETWNTQLIGSYPTAQFRDLGWTESLVDTTVLSPGVGDPGTTTNPESLDKLMDAYEYLRSMSLMEMSFEDYLRTFGVSVNKEQERKPELIVRWSEWQYPSNTVDPLTGTATAAVSWVHKKTERKNKFFREPGFIVGVKMVRPKVYLGRQYGSMSHYLDNGLSWLPAIMKDSPETSLREFTGGIETANTGGPLSNGTVGPTNGYWVDMRDLFLYGDQFANFDIAAALGDAHAILSPTAALNQKYPTAADVDTFFKGATAATRLIRADGFVSFSIKGMQRDYTRSVSADLS